MGQATAARADRQAGAQRHRRANPVEVIVAESALGRGIAGVIDGASPLGTETAADVDDRRQLLRDIGYKL